MTESILIVSLNHKKAPVSIREKFKIQQNELSRAMRFLKNNEGIVESLILSTCNRTEFYVCASDVEQGLKSIVKFISEWFGMNPNDFIPYLQPFVNSQAAKHLFKVSCGLDSLVIGETQILGQIKDSFIEAQQTQTTGVIFNELFKRAISFAKHIHSTTDIGRKAVSVSYAAVELTKQIFGSLQNKSILILGTGKMGELALENLAANGIQNVIVMNRTYQKAQELANKFRGQAQYLDKLEDILLNVDIVITSSSSETFILTKDLMERISKRRNKAIVLVDISLPRNIQPEVIEVDNCYLYDLDDLQEVVNKNLSERKQLATIIENHQMIEAIEDFQQWVQLLEVKPIISSLNELGNQIFENTFKSIENKLPSLSERERKIISKHTRSAINQILRNPIENIKSLYMEDIKNNADNVDSINMISQLFNLKIEKKKYFKIINFSSQQVKNENIMNDHIISENIFMKSYL